MLQSATKYTYCTSIMLFNFFVFLLTDQASSLTEQTGKLNISVYYETLCPDCQNFMLNQLAPTIWKLRNHTEAINLDLIPFGKVMKVGRRYICHHGSLECEGNKLNACAIHQLIKKEQTPQHQQLMNFITCTMLKDNPILAAKKCSKPNKVNYKRLMSCFAGNKGRKLMLSHESRTNALQPSLTWVPTIVFNNKFNETENMMAQEDFNKVVCSYLPKHCQ